MTNLRVLFVDDETMVLSALQRALRSQSSGWDMFFLSSAEECWTLMSEHTIDVVISDMQMPGTDGAQFLAQVRERYPATIRMVFSGFKDKDVALHTSAAHRFLTKPLMSTLLVDHVLHAVSGLPADLTMRAIVNGAACLLSTRSAVTRLNEVLTDPAVHSSQIAAVVMSDPALATKVLQLGNSSVLGPVRVGAAIEACVDALGSDTLRRLAADPGFARHLPLGDPREDLVEALARHAVSVASSLAAEAPDDRKTEAYSGGLVHVAGSLLAIEHGLEATGDPCEGSSGNALSMSLLNAWAIPGTVTEVARSVGTSLGSSPPSSKLTD